MPGLALNCFTIPSIKGSFFFQIFFKKVHFLGFWKIRFFKSAEVYCPYPGCKFGRIKDVLLFQVPSFGYSPRIDILSATWRLYQWTKVIIGQYPQNSSRKDVRSLRIFSWKQGTRITVEETTEQAVQDEIKGFFINFWIFLLFLFRRIKCVYSNQRT